MSKFKNAIPMNIPRIGGNMPTPDIKDAEFKQCKCGCEYFDKVFKVGTISELAPSNKTGKSISAELVVFVCCQCGEELYPLDGRGEDDKL